MKALAVGESTGFGVEEEEEDGCELLLFEGFWGLSSSGSSSTIAINGDF